LAANDKPYLAQWYGTSCYLRKALVLIPSIDVYFK